MTCHTGTLLLHDSEEESALAVRDDVQFNALANNLHHPEIIGGDRQDDDAIVVFICLLHLNQITLDLVVDLYWRVGQKYGTLNGRASLALQILVHKCAHLVASYVVHH